MTLAGFHQLNYGMFELASGYKKRGMAAYSELQQQEFAAEKRGYTAHKHQREVGLLAAVLPLLIFLLGLGFKTAAGWQTWLDFGGACKASQV